MIKSLNEGGQPTLGDAPIEMKFRDAMNQLAANLDAFFNPQLVDGVKQNGFVLMVFPFGGDPEGKHRCNYISNANRLDIIKLLEEQVSYFKAQDEAKNASKQ